MSQILIETEIITLKMFKLYTGSWYVVKSEHEKEVLTAPSIHLGMNSHSFLLVEAQTSVMSTQCERSNRTGSSTLPPQGGTRQGKGRQSAQRLPSKAILGGKWENEGGGRVTGSVPPLSLQV